MGHHEYRISDAEEQQGRLADRRAQNRPPDSRLGGNHATVFLAAWTIVAGVGVAMECLLKSPAHQLSPPADVVPDRQPTTRNTAPESDPETYPVRNT